MRKLLAFALLAAASASAPAFAPPQAPRDAAAEVRRLEREWLDAYEKHDAEAMDRIVAEDFTITFPDGRVQTKPQLMRQVRAPRREGAPSFRFRTEQVESRVYGDTVILTGVFVSETTRGDKTETERLRFTDTYARIGGRWRVVASHLSQAPALKP